ncbi:ABC transporter permease [Georgenia deserti]|uniref:ABC transporter permease n=1 Tax=Georgenia deserti TaxID=2093781 RepID=A0ABW4L941_9MICO
MTAAEQTQLPDEPPQTRERRSAGPVSLHQFLAFGALIVVFAFFAVANGNFLTMNNVANILLAASVTGTLALGVTFIIATGGIDLSVGTGMTLCSVMTAVFATQEFIGLPMPVGVLLGVAFGALIGLVNGVNVAVLGIPPFIATLGMMMAANGLALVISDATPLYFTSVPGFGQIALGSIIPRIPNAVVIFLVLAVIAGVVLGKTLIGRYALSIGSNEEATRMSGVNTRSWLIRIYVLGGAFTGIAGVMMASRLNSAQPALGVGYELEAIAAVVIGGTSLSGGRGSILGTIIGAILMATLNNGLQILAVPQEWQKVAVGVVILVAVFADNVRRRREGRL